MFQILEFLQSNNIPFEKYDHPALFTCEDSEKHGVKLAGADTKNLFLRDKKGSRHFLVVVPHSKQADLLALSSKLKLSRLSFGSPERLKDHLGVTPGSVSILAIVNDPNGKVEVIFDEAIWNADQIQCHPLINTSTLVIPNSGVRKFLELTKHSAKVVDVPAKTSPTTGSS